MAGKMRPAVTRKGTWEVIEGFERHEQAVKFIVDRKRSYKERSVDHPYEYRIKQYGRDWGVERRRIA